MVCYILFRKGTLTNEVLITPNEDIYLDGNLVTVSTTTQGAELSSISPRAYYEYWDYDTTAFATGPYDKNKTTKETTVALQQKIGQVTLSAVAGIVVFSMSGGNPYLSGAAA